MEQMQVSCGFRWTVGNGFPRRPEGIAVTRVERNNRATGELNRPEYIIVKKRIRRRTASNVDEDLSNVPRIR